MQIIIKFANGAGPVNPDSMTVIMKMAGGPGKISYNKQKL